MQELKDAITKARRREKVTNMPELEVVGVDRRQVGVKPDFERIANEQAAQPNDDVYSGRTMPELEVTAPRPYRPVLATPDETMPKAGIVPVQVNYSPTQPVAAEPFRTLPEVEITANRMVPDQASRRVNGTSINDGSSIRRVGIKPDFERIANEQASQLEDDLYSGRTMPTVEIVANRTAPGQAERRVYGTSVNDGSSTRRAGVKPDFERIANEQAALLEDDLYNGRTMPELVVSAPRTTAGQAERRAFGTSVNEGNAAPATTLVVPDETGRLTMAVPAESMPAAQMVPVDASNIASLPVAEQVKEGEKKEPSGESAGKSASTDKAKTVQTTPAAAGQAAAQQVQQVPTWQDLIRELTELDEDSEERKAEIRKKQRIAAAIAALGDVATHAINVWGASNGYSAPIKGAPLTEGIANQHKLQLAEHDARLERLKKLRMDAAEARRKDLYDKIKLGEFQRKERESADKAEYNKLKEELLNADIQYRKEMIAYRNAKTEQDKEMHRKKMEKIDVEKANIKDQMAKRGISSSRRTYTVDGVTYDNLAEAYTALPKEYKIEIRDDLNGRPIKPSEFDIEEAIAKYNRDNKTSPAEQPAQQGKKEEEKPKATSLIVNADGTKEVTFS